MSMRKINTGFAGRLKNLREAAGLTQAQLAEQSGLNAHGIAKLEQGISEPHWPTVLLLAKALGVSVEAFVPPDGVILAESEKRPRGRPAKREGKPAKREGNRKDTAARGRKPGSRA